MTNEPAVSGQTQMMAAEAESLLRENEALKDERDHWKARVSLGYDDQRKLEAEIARLRAERDELLTFARFVLRGCESGNIKSKNIVDMGSRGKPSMELLTLADMARAAIARCQP